MIKKQVTKDRYREVHDRLMCAMIRELKVNNSKRLHHYGNHLYLLRKKYRTRFAA